MLIYIKKAKNIYICIWFGFQEFVTFDEKELSNLLKGWDYIQNKV